MSDQTSAGKGPTDEPVAWGGAISALAIAGIPVLRAFGVSITKDQADAVLAFLAAVIGFGTLLVRAQVTPVAKARDVIDAAYLTQPGEPKPKL
jgi:hypothetical protein